ncbi:MAG: hypothetical protein U9N62_00695 [Thermotogota bacterium]|nr:hypothetical protein [Thermotogota bacterium]
MKKQVVLTITLVLFSLLIFGMQNGEYMFKLLNQEAATETASFKQVSTDVVNFESTTDLHFQMQHAVYQTKGQIKDNLIVDYQLSVLYNNSETVIHCTLNDDILTYTINNVGKDIPIEGPLLILDNNLAWSWQLVYNLYHENGYEAINVFIPQLLLKNFTEILPLEIQKTTQTEEDTNVFFSYNGQSGMLKVDENHQVFQLLMGGTQMEKTK